MAKGIFERLAELVLTRGVSEIVKRVWRENKKENKKRSPPAPKPSSSSQAEEKVHPWRTCPIGQHWRRTHPVHVPSSEKNPKGITTRIVGCCKNPQRKNKRVVKDVIHPEEIHRIAKDYFSGLTGSPAGGKLKQYEDADKYDDLIRGWTKYWNEIFKPEVLLDPDVVKALIASESRFKSNPKPVSAGKAGKAHGLIQLTDEAIQALSNPNGELKDHLVMIKEVDILDPNVTLCAGIRWLFQKRKLTTYLLGREATWEETIANYKAYLNDMLSGKNKNPEGMINFRERLKELKQ